MSTRGVFTFRDADGTFNVYKQSDCYLHGGLYAICNALHYSWPVPRFEADEFAASFVAGNKGRLSEAAISLKRIADRLPEPKGYEDFKLTEEITLNRHYRMDGGGIRMLASGPDVSWQDVSPWDAAYHYDVGMLKGKLMVICSAFSEKNDQLVLKKVWKGDVLPFRHMTWEDWCAWDESRTAKVAA